MSAPDPPPRRLPPRPSLENLRKQAKRLAKLESIKLAAAQRRLARSYGFASWAALASAVEAIARPARSPLSQAAARADLAAVDTLLAGGASVEGEPNERDSPLFVACDGEAPAAPPPSMPPPAAARPSWSSFC